MRRLILVLSALCALGAALWAAGAFAAFGAWVLEAQRAVQAPLAGAVRALRAGEAGALAGFLGICAAYGALHAAGPGHGKLVIGGYGAVRRVTARRLSMLALVSSLAQAGVAVLAVYALVAILGASRQAAGAAVEGIIAPLGSALLVGLGLYLLWRGARGLRGQGAVDHNHHAHSDHTHSAECGCGHAHGPSVAQVQAAQSWREMAALVAGIALRPCTGAVFVLILTWQLGIGTAGIAGAFAMGLGTAAFTAAVALTSVGAREGALARLGAGQLARVLPIAEIIAGAVIGTAAMAALIAAL
jgi:nickel/cobalt transporter (NicO) family protein